MTEFIGALSTTPIWIVCVIVILFGAFIFWMIGKDTDEEVKK